MVPQWIFSQTSAIITTGYQSQWQWHHSPWYVILVWSLPIEYNSNIANATVRHAIRFWSLYSSFRSFFSGYDFKGNSLDTRTLGTHIFGGYVAEYIKDLAIWFGSVHIYYTRVMMKSDTSLNFQHYIEAGIEDDRLQEMYENHSCTDQEAKFDNTKSNIV